MLKEIIENNQVTTLFQNKRRFRSGKLYRKMTADMSIRWLLDAHKSLSNKNIVIVPVMLSYDRIYEQGNLSRVMISSQKKEFNLRSTISRMYNTPNNSLGDVHIKYLEPINLKSYLTNLLGSDILDHEGFEKAAFELTDDLMEI